MHLSLAFLRRLPIIARLSEPPRTWALTRSCSSAWHRYLPAVVGARARAARWNMFTAHPIPSPDESACAAPGIGKPRKEGKGGSETDATRWLETRTLKGRRQSVIQMQARARTELKSENKNKHTTSKVRAFNAEILFELFICSAARTRCYHRSSGRK